MDDAQSRSLNLHELQSPNKQMGNIFQWLIAESSKNTFTYIDTFTLNDNYSHLLYVTVCVLTTPVTKGMNTVGILEFCESNKNYLTASRHKEVVSADLAKYSKSD